MTNNQWDFIDKDTQRKCVDEVIVSLNEATGEEVGMIAAQEIVDIVN